MPMEDTTLKEALIQAGFSAGSAEEVASRIPASALTAEQVAQIPPLVSGDWNYSPYLGQELLAVVVGNSIAAACRWTGAVSTGWSPSNEIMHANHFAGAPLVWGEYTANAQMDKYGVYGYSGKRLDEILSDLSANFFTPIGSTKPKVVIANALVENDIGQGASAETIIRRLKQFVREVRGRWPQAVLVIGTPHPNLTYNAAQGIVHHTIRDYIISLENLSSIRVYRNDGYEDQAQPGVPLPGYTDSSVHPNHLGAMVNGRALGDVLRSITGGAVMRSMTRGSANYAMSGSGSIAATNVSGTAPTSCTHTGVAAGALVSLAETPGWLMTLTQTAGQSSDAGTCGLGSVSVSGGGSTRVCVYAEVEVVSGAENLRSVSIEPRIQDGGGNTFQYEMRYGSSDADGGYQNGDRLMPRSHWMAAVSGSISAVQPYLRFVEKTGGAGSSTVLGGVVQVRILQAGVDTLAA